MDLGDRKKTRWLICLALALVTIAVYWRVGGFDFVNYDDPDYVSENDVVKAGLTLHGIAWAFTHFHAGNWHPLTWISHMLDCQLFGMHAGAHHWVNVAFHMANAILLFLLLSRLTGAQWRSAIAAALFALHPLHVESVAWIAERKDVLSAFFGLLALLAYARYVAESKIKNQKSKMWLIWTVVLFASGLMAKPMLVTLPFVMLLLDVWPLQRVENSGWRSFFTKPFGKLAFEKWPLFLLAAASCVVTFFAQKTGGAVVGMEHLPFGARVANAVTAYFDYVLKAFWPVHLAVFYPLSHEQSMGHLALAVVCLAVISIAAIAVMKRWPFLLVGWLWFLGTLVPVIGLVQVGSQAMADRYTYIPFIGLFIAVVWGISECVRFSKGARTLAAASAVAVVVICAALTISQLRYWRNSLALFTHALEVTRGNAPANNNLGTALAAAGEKGEALAYYQKAVDIDPNNAHYQNNLATALARADQPEEAIQHYLAAERIDPHFAAVYSNLGQMFSAQRQFDAAVTNFNEAIRLDPHDANLRFNAGLVLVKAGRTNDAVTQFTEAVRLKPSFAEARFQLGRLLFFQGQFPAAIEQLTEAAKLRPDYALAQFYLSAALAQTGHFDEATSIGNEALASAQRSGPTSLIPRLQEALEFYKAHRPLLQKPGDANQ